MNLSRRSVLASAASAAVIASVVPVSCFPSSIESYADTGSNQMTVAAWQRMMAEHIERVVRPPSILHSNGKREIVLNPHQDETFKALMACKPVGA